MAAADAGGAALGGPRPNPSDDAPRLRSPPGKGKAVALADISNTGRRNNTRSLSVADVVKENGMLVELLKQKTRIIELSRAEIQKLRLMLQAKHQQNVQLAQAHSQMLAELNQGKDMLKALQHEFSCNAALLKVKDAEQKEKNKAANQRCKVNSQDDMKAIPSKVAAGVGPRIDGSVNSSTEDQLVESRSVVPSTTGCQEPSNNITTRRGRNKRKSESTTGKDMEIQETCSILPGIEIHQIGATASNTKRSHSAEMQLSLPFNIVEAPKDLEDTDNERGASTSEPLHHSERRKSQSRKSARLDSVRSLNKMSTSETMHEDVVCPLPHCSSNALMEQTSKQTLKNGKDSVIEHINTSVPLHHSERRISQMRKSAQLDSVLSLNKMCNSETVHEDVVCPLPHSSSNALMEQAINQKQTDDCSSTEASEGQVAGRRRSMRRSAEKVVSYKEISVNAKMRRP